MRKTSSKKSVPSEPAGTEDWSLFDAEASYADSIVRTAARDIEGAVNALESSLRSKPDYAPAILSLGSVEYQRGKAAKGKRLFLSLVDLDHDDIVDIVDMAGSFLIDQSNYRHGLDLYRAAARRFPDVAVFQSGLACCAGHMDQHSEAVEASEKALQIEPGNPEFTSDLGWSLIHAGRLVEAEKLLQRAVQIDASSEIAQNNLKLCRDRMAGQKKTIAGERFPMKQPETLCPDFPEWPIRWKGVEEDEAYGQALLDLMRPFVSHLIAEGMTEKTIRSHIDNLFLLGGEIIRDVSTFDEYKVSAERKLSEAVGPHGGPSCRHLDSEAQVRSFDATCRKLHKFLRA